MAVIVPGSIVGDIRGSVGAETYSRNQGGLYVRARAGPTAPPTANQIAIHDAMAALSQAWSTTLTQQQRDDWQSYAEQHPRPNRWGAKNLTNGYTRFIATNFPEQVRTSALFRTAAPTAAPLPPPQFNWTAGWDDAEILISLPFDLPLPDDSTLRAYFYIGRDQTLGVNFYDAPFQFLDTNLKTNGIWSRDPWWKGVVPFNISADSHRWGRMRVLDTVTGAISTVGQRMITTQSEL